VRLRRKLLILAAAIGIFFLLVIAAGMAVLFSPLLTRYVEGDAFRVAMEEETAKGLHFPEAHYASISFFVSSAIGSRKHLAAISSAF
jgi:hypothetical protein